MRAKDITLLAVLGGTALFGGEWKGASGGEDAEAEPYASSPNPWSSDAPDHGPTRWAAGDDAAPDDLTPDRSPARAYGFTPAAAPQTAVYYRNCAAARAAGAAPIYRGQPGYRIEMDGDNDGIACEPYRGR